MRTCGCSNVIFAHMRSRGMGKASVGILVIHNAKSSLAGGFKFGSANLSQMTASDGSQFGEKWQFCKITHPPTVAASMMACSAPCSCPRPIEMAFVFRDMPRDAASFWIVRRGSIPAERTRRTGVNWPALSKAVDSEGVGQFTNHGEPIVSVTIFLTSSTTLSGRMQRRTSVL